MEEVPECQAAQALTKYEAPGCLAVKSVAAGPELDDQGEAAAAVDQEEAAAAVDQEETAARTSQPAAEEAVSRGSAAAAAAGTDHDLQWGDNNLAYSGGDNNLANSGGNNLAYSGGNNLAYSGGLGGANEKQIPKTFVRLEETLEATLEATLEYNHDAVDKETESRKAMFPGPGSQRGRGRQSSICGDTLSGKLKEDMLISGRYLKIDS